MKKREMILEKAFEEACDTLAFFIGCDTTKTNVMAEYWARAEEEVGDALTDNQKKCLREKLDLLTQATHHKYVSIMFRDGSTLLEWTDSTNETRIDVIDGWLVSFPDVITKGKIYYLKEWLS